MTRNRDIGGAQDQAIPRIARMALATGVAVVTLSACSLGGKPPKFLLTLPSAAAVKANTVRSAPAAEVVMITAPVVPTALRTARIPVQAADGTVAYVKNAAWVDQPARLFQHLLADTITATTGRVVLDPAQTVAVPGLTVSGQLLDFGIDARSNEAVVVYQAVLADPSGRILRQQRFVARQPVAEIKPLAVQAALTAAANAVARDVAGWVG